MKLEEYALQKYPDGKIDGFSHEDYFGDIVWITTPDKSTHIVSQFSMLMELEGVRHSSEMAKIRSNINLAMGAMK